jgi:hypothetical protein
MMLALVVLLGILVLPLENLLYLILSCSRISVTRNFSNKNFELVVREFDDLLRHYLNDLGGGTNAWNRGPPVYD